MIVVSIKQPKKDPPAYQYPARSMVDHTPYLPKMPKFEYTRFMESTRLVFARGDLVTFTHWAPKDDTQAPPQVYRITSFEEFWYNAHLDTSNKQPKCIHIANISKQQQNVGFYTSPERIRKLTEKEVAIVNLSDSPIQGNA